MSLRRLSSRPFRISSSALVPDLCQHQVNLRDDLLQFCSDSDDEDEDEEEEAEDEEQEEEEAEEDQQHAHPCEAPRLTSKEALLHQHHCLQLEALQEKLRLLEENYQLREEASQLNTLEDEEQMLILECMEQFYLNFLPPQLCNSLNGPAGPRLLEKEPVVKLCCFYCLGMA
ncbi:hap1 transcriptional regulatory prottein [Saguinus oedipus]|uniref:Hap1 transcriptional regulatory prottein n=1 Tax=Saguinus oedipus TaxID=9490 RepID=A0ABQ9VNK9_SAGOE|nr:hap1 transcriptional regulatory prottein [Saguinus oedipus]